MIVPLLSATACDLSYDMAHEINTVIQQGEVYLECAPDLVTN